MKMNGIGHDRTALVLYGTETGTSQDLAEEVGRLTQRIHFDTNVAGLDDVAISELHRYTVTIFVIATTGQGEFPSNALSFWKSLLKKKLPRDFFDGLQYALAGLGDSSYPKYNWAGRKLDKRLQQLGALPVLEACEADEQDDEGTEGVIVPWLQRLSTTLLSKFPLADGVAPIPQSQPLASQWVLTTTINETGHVGKYDIFPSTLPDLDNRPIPGALTATLKKNERVTPSDHWQDVRLLVLAADEGVEYLPGDALAIMPKNFTTDVDLFVSLMEWQEVADNPIALRLNVHLNKQPSEGIRPPIPNLEEHPNITLRTLLTEYLDITAIPRRSFFAAIARFTENDMHKERLLEFTDPQFLDEYFDYATRPRRSILEILQEFSSVRIPWQEACNVLPLIRPRQFSIASGGFSSSGTYTGSHFELLVAIVKYRTVIKKIRQGVCTRYLAALPENSSIKIVLRREGRFPLAYKMPTRHNLLIGAGTGIAPLRALVHEEIKSSVACRDQVTRTNTLIFGSRSEKADFFFRDEWTKLIINEEGDFSLITAFSRDQKQKVYVQDKIREHGEAVTKLLCNMNTNVFVCGSSGAMPKAVRRALLDVLMEHASTERPWSLEKAEMFLNAMEKQNRYIQETW
jgi:sulfite reductase alpha subunit-like flavoprotein